MYMEQMKKRYAKQEEIECIDIIIHYKDDQL